MAPLGNPLPLLLSQATPYQIDQSLRFNSADNTVLTRNVTTGGNRTTWTFSCWVKRSETGVIHEIFTAAPGAHASSAAITYLALDDADKLMAYSYHDNAEQFRLKSDAVFRDLSAWYHIVWRHDTTLATADDRVRLYVNGEQVTSFLQRTNPGPSYESKINDTIDHTLGEEAIRDRYNLNGYLAEVNFIDGSALGPESFGELDDFGVWRPIKYAGSYTGQSWYLKFDAADVGGDSSGLGNDWTASASISTSGTGTDVMSDTPTTNWCTLNPLDKNSGQLPKDGNLYFDGSVSTGGLDVIAGTMRVSSGKYYWESTITAVGSIAVAAVGITKIQSVGRSASGSLGSVSGECAYLPSGNKNVDGTNSAYGSSFTTGDTIGVALDCDAGTVTFYKNNTSQGAITYAVGDGLAPAIGQVQGYGAIQTVNFGQRDFAYTPPTGFKALNTANLPAPDIADGSDYFTTLAYSGTSTTDSKVIKDSQDNAWAPDFVWLKKRNSGANHMLYDRVRDASKSLRTNTDGVEVTGATNGDLTAFTSTGFTLNSGNDVNASGNTYVAWNWLAANGTSTPSGGSIASTVSANPTAGFSIVSFTGKTYTGNSSTDTGTVAHGLGVAPSFYVVKARNGTSDWICYHSELGNTKYIELNQINSATTQTGMWASTSPTDTVFTMGPFWPSNIADGKTMIAYCFAEVEGYSKFGSYEGNNTDNSNAFIYLGFTPTFVMIKNADASSNWIIHDTTRDTYNPSSTDLYPNTNGGEPAYEDNYMDFLSNGIKIRDTSGPSGNSNTYIYAAFASHPFGGSGVSPATAR